MSTFSIRPESARALVDLSSVDAKLLAAALDHIADALLDPSNSAADVYEDVALTLEQLGYVDNKEDALL